MAKALQRAQDQYTEYNVAKLGLISIQSKINANVRRGWAQEVHEEENSAGIRCSTGHDSGIPHGVAGDVLSALITETIAAPQSGGPIKLRMTAADLARASGLSVMGKSYDRVLTALYQLRHTNYQLWDHWITPLYQIEQETVLTLLPELKVRRETSLHFPNQQTIYIEAQLHPTVVASINGTLALATDPAIMHELSSPTARGLYRVLEALRRDSSDVTRLMPKTVVPARALVNACRILGAGKHISRQLETLTRSGGAFDQLCAAGYLKSVDWVGSGDNLKVGLEFGQDGQIMDTKALRYLHEYGVVGANAETLAMTFTREAIECAVWLVETRQRKRNDIGNPQGLLIKMLRDGSATQSLEQFRNSRKPIRRQEQKHQNISAEVDHLPTLAEALTGVGLLETLKGLKAELADQLRRHLEAGRIEVTVPRSLFALPNQKVHLQVQEILRDLGADQPLATGAER